MADYLASIFGTEKDKVNCSFYFKIGACRHGERCSRIHNKPTFSQTILLQNLYQNPQNVTQSLDPLGKETTIQRVHTMSDEEAQEHFDDFFEDVFVELEDKYGEIEEMNVCDNLGDHLVGNVYVKFRREEDAERAVQDLNNRWFGGRPIYAELSPVTDFREACCRQYEMGECTRSGFCNFMHIKPISRELRRELYGRRRAAALERRNASSSSNYIDDSRSRSVERHRSRERDHRDRRDRDRDRDSKRKSSSSRRHRSRSKSRSKDRDHRDHHHSHRRHSHRSSKHSRSKDRDHSSRDRNTSDGVPLQEVDDNANQSYAINNSQDGFQPMMDDHNTENIDYNNSNNGLSSIMMASGGSGSGGGGGPESSIDNYSDHQQQNIYNNGENNGQQESQSMIGGLYGSLE